MYISYEMKLDTSFCPTNARLKLLRQPGEPTAHLLSSVNPETFP